VKQNVRREVLENFTREKARGTNLKSTHVNIVLNIYEIGEFNFKNVFTRNQNDIFIEMCF